MCDIISLSRSWGHFMEEQTNSVKTAIQAMLEMQTGVVTLKDVISQPINIVQNYVNSEEFVLEELTINEDRLLNNHQIHAINKNTHEIVIPLAPSIVGLRKDYTLDNIPDHCESASLQQYHFIYTPEQLKEMYTTTKIIVDIHYNMFDTSNGKVQRTSFFAIAPHAKIHKGIPPLYRFSVSRDLKNANHYSISMYAIVGGKEDGWLFLGRLDNDDTSPHSFLVESVSKNEARRANAVRTKGITQAQQNIMARYQKESCDMMHDIYCIPFPHIHQPNAKYEIGDKPEKCCPKFLRKCVDNSFEENLQYMMKIFSISDQPHLKIQNDTMANIIKEEYKITHINPMPNPYKLVSAINSGYRENRPKFIKEISDTELRPAQPRQLHSDIFRSPKYKNKERKMLMRTYKMNKK